jgi:Ca2+-binding EF-hand superfamily protein
MALARHNSLSVTRALVRIAVESGDLPRRPPLSAAQRGALLAAFRGQGGAVASGKQFTGLLWNAGVVLKDLGLTLTQGDLFTLMDVDRSGRVDKREFLATLSYLLEPALAPEDRLRFLFDAYDTDGNGQLDRREMKEMLGAYGFPPPPLGGGFASEEDRRKVEEAERLLHDLFAAFDRDRSGGLDFGELTEALRKTPALQQLVEGTAWMGAGAASPRAEPAPSPPSTPAGAAAQGERGAGGGGGARRRQTGSLASSS